MYTQLYEGSKRLCQVHVPADASQRLEHISTKLGLRVEDVPATFADALIRDRVDPTAEEAPDVARPSQMEEESTEAGPRLSGRESKAVCRWNPCQFWSDHDVSKLYVPHRRAVASLPLAPLRRVVRDASAAAAAPPAPAAASPPSCADVDAAEAAPADTSGVEVTGEVSREDIERRKRKRAIDVDALELDPVKVEVKEEAC